MAQYSSTVDADLFSEFYEKVHAVESAHELFSLIKRIATTFGFAHYSILYIPETVETELRPHLVSTDWPEQLLVAYDEHGLLENSPIIKKLRSGRSPVPYDLDAANLDRPSQEQLVTVNLFRNHRMSRGVYFPCFDSRGRKGAISFFGDRELPSLEETSKLHILSNYCFNRLYTLLKTDTADANLTPRERECLNLAAKGKTNAECSEVLGISENTVAGYLASTAKKLSARNKAHLIALAFEFGILNRHEGE